MLRWEPGSGGSPHHHAPPPPSSPQRTINATSSTHPGMAVLRRAPPPAPGAGELGRSRPWMVHAEAGTLRVLPAGLSGGAGAEPEGPAAVRGKLGVSPCRIASLLLWFAWLQRARVVGRCRFGFGGQRPGDTTAQTLGSLGLAQPRERGSPGCHGPACALRGVPRTSRAGPPPAGCPALAIVPAPTSLSCMSPAAPGPLSPPRGGGRCLQRCSSSLW